MPAITPEDVREQVDSFNYYKKYTTLLSFGAMEELELFEDLKYGDVKKYFKNDNAHEVSIERVGERVDVFGTQYYTERFEFTGYGDGEGQPFRIQIQYYSGCEYDDVVSGLWCSIIEQEI